MRQMVPYPERGPTAQFRCTECDWVFYIQNPMLESVPVQERRKATAWFNLHSCSEFPRRGPKPPLKPVRITLDFGNQHTSSAIHKLGV